MFVPALRALLPCVLILLLGRPGDAWEAIAVQRGIELQQAIDRARPGDVITLTPGAVYSGNFVLPVHAGADVITIRTADGPGQPQPGVRIVPAHAGSLAVIQSPNRQPALRTAPGARHWRIELIEFRATQDGAGDIITLGDGSSAQRDRAQVPSALVIDRCYIHGDAVAGQKRGIALNSGQTTISNSHISDIKARGQDAQAIAGWNGPGPYLIENNYLEGSGDNFLLGGADPAIPNLIVEDVVFRRNHLSKPVQWRAERWTVKNLFELKNARRVLVEGNLMEHSWRDAQVGYAILLTPRNQDGRAPWSTVQDVTIRNNVIRHAGGAMQIVGNDTIHPSGPTQRIVVSNNLIYGIDSQKWGGTGAFALIGEGPSDVTIEHNTISQTGNILIAYGGTKESPKAISGFTFRDNLVRHNQYGVHGSDRGVGADSLRAYFPGAVFDSNGIAGGDARAYPGGNTFLPEPEFDAQFVNAPANDFRLKPGSRFRRAASDGKDLGIDFALIARAMGLRPGVRIP